MTASDFGHRVISKPDGSRPDGWHSYVCGHCGHSVSGAVIGYIGRKEGGHLLRWLQCSSCHDASVMSDSGEYFPGVEYGPDIEGLPNDVADAYKEARRCMSVNAFTAAELLCRKILMHVAVDKGAKEGDTFAGYIRYLEEDGYVTPPMKHWVDLIKKHGNDATHKLPQSDQERAKGTIQFAAQLLRSVYEMDYLAKQYGPSPESTTPA